MPFTFRNYPVIFFLPSFQEKSLFLGHVIKTNLATSTCREDESGLKLGFASDLVFYKTIQYWTCLNVDCCFRSVQQATSNGSNTRRPITVRMHNVVFDVGIATRLTGFVLTNQPDEGVSELHSGGDIDEKVEAVM